MNVEDVATLRKRARPLVIVVVAIVVAKARSERPLSVKDARRKDKASK